eukprot:TRINITY_DN15259_c0_g1_i3.p2 TRINITY_DN15259_c0_g1~~TRINITY_DN15259_c0_g1_i3.p2  ORF type:complete len:102 (+),score=24.40 TRINITY_DN15259_c0_g1_i3:626-931(+)
MSSQLDSFTLSIISTKSTDEGVAILVAALSSLQSLSKLYLDFYRCLAVTDKSAKKFADLIEKMPSLSEITLLFESTGVSQGDLEEIIRKKSQCHKLFDIKL